MFGQDPIDTSACILYLTLYIYIYITRISKLSLALHLFGRPSSVLSGLFGSTGTHAFLRGKLWWGPAGPGSSRFWGSVPFSRSRCSLSLPLRLLLGPREVCPAPTLHCLCISCKNTIWLESHVIFQLLHLCNDESPQIKIARISMNKLCRKWWFYTMLSRGSSTQRTWIIPFQTLSISVIHQAIHQQNICLYYTFLWLQGLTASQRVSPPSQLTKLKPRIQLKRGLSLIVCGLRRILTQQDSDSKLGKDSVEFSSAGAPAKKKKGTVLVQTVPIRRSASGVTTRKSSPPRFQREVNKC